MSRFTESNNPLVRDKTFDTLDKDLILDYAERSTIAGSINKTLILFGILLGTTLLSYQMPSQAYLLIGALGGLVVFFIVMFKPNTAPVLAPVYAALEGFFVGTISFMYASAFEGIVFQALMLTFGTLLSMLVLYKSGLITITEKFRSIVMMATGAIFLVYIASFLGSFVGFTVPYLHDSSPLGIGISVVIIGVAALNLLLDFDLFERVEKEGAPKYMEWFCGMVLLVTLIWLYIEFLRLLAKLKE